MAMKSKSVSDYGGLFFAWCLAVVAGVVAGKTGSLDSAFGRGRQLFDISQVTLLIGAAIPLVVVAWVFGRILRGYRLAAISVLLVFGFVGYVARYNSSRGEFVALIGFLAVMLFLAAMTDAPAAPSRRDAVDAPLIDENDDALHRSSMVTLLELLVESKSIRCPRVALVGPVGCGKSTVVNFVASRLESLGHEVVRFNPWHQGGALSTAESLIRSVEGALRLGGVVSNGFGLRYLVGEMLVKWTTLQAFWGPSSAEFTGAKVQVEELLRTRLGPNRRLVVVVEDLERCAGGVVSDLLMRMHELVDADGLAYLFAFDLQRVERLLQKEAPLDQALLDKVFDHVVSMPATPTSSLQLLWEKFAGAIGLPVWMAKQWPVDANLIPDTPRNIKRFAAYCAAVPKAILRSEDDWERRMIFYLSLLEFVMPGVVSGMDGKGEVIRELEGYSVRLMMRERAGIASQDSIAPVNEALKPWGEVGTKNVGLFVRAAEHAARNSSFRGISVTDLARAIQGLPIAPRSAIDESLNSAVLHLQDPSKLESILEGDLWKTMSGYDRIQTLFRGMNTAVRMSFRTALEVDYEIARTWGERLVLCVKGEAAATNDPRASVLALQVGFFGLYWGFAEQASSILRGFTRRVRRKTDVAWELLGTPENRFIDTIDPMLEASWMRGVLEMLEALARRRVIEDFGEGASTSQIGQDEGRELDVLRRSLMSKQTSEREVYAWRRVARGWVTVDERQRAKLAFGCLEDIAKLVQDRRIDKRAALPASNDMLALFGEIRLSDFAVRRLSSLRAILT